MVSPQNKDMQVILDKAGCIYVFKNRYVCTYFTYTLHVKTVYE